jgi:two-component system sensor histidine kinase UhpB
MPPAVPASPPENGPSHLVRVLVIGFAAVLVLLAVAGLTVVRDSRGIRATTSRLVAEQSRIARLMQEVQAEETVIRELLHRLAFQAPAEVRQALGNRIQHSETSLARLAAEGSASEDAPLWHELRRNADSFFGTVYFLLDMGDSVARPAQEDLFRQHDGLATAIEAIVQQNARLLESAESAVTDQSEALATDSSVLLGGSLSLAGLCAAATVGLVRHGLRRMARQADELNRVSWQMLQSQEEVARRFSHELHDELGQSLAALRSGLVKSETADLETLRADCVHLVDESIANVRELSQLLRPVILDDFGLDAGLRSLTEKFAQRARIEIRYESDVAVRYADATETHLYRIAQEALTNVARHSGATAVRVSLTEAGGQLRLTIADNGRGIPGDSEESPRGLGLTGMRARARQCGGGVVLSTPQGGGVQIQVVVPAVRPETDAGPE